jgi:hypothetical protein
MSEFSEPIEMSGKSVEETRPIHRHSGKFPCYVCPTSSSFMTILETDGALLA